MQYTLEPLVYVGPAEGQPKAEWKLKSAAELLDLKICDMACGSGAFLVQSARYMSERLMEAWDAAKEQYPNVPGITPEGKPSTGEPHESLIPDDPAERTTYAMRLIAQRCLYGVDVNPLAAEMANLSLWLLTLAKDKPFEFLDHAIRCGDSLVGLYTIDQLRHFSLKPDADDAVLFGGPFEEAVDAAIALRLQLAKTPANTVEDVEAQEALLQEADDKIARLRCAADLLVSAEFWGENAKDNQEKVRHAAVVAGHYVEKGPTEEFEEKAEKERRGQRMFHWPLEFPEVVVKRGGFDAFVGNPPFMGVAFITQELGEGYVSWLASHHPATSGKFDLCAQFLVRAASLLGSNGVMGFLATNTVSQGDTRKTGLCALHHQGWRIYDATNSLCWPGTAAVTVSVVHCERGLRNVGVDCVLDGETVQAINSRLRPKPERPDPTRLTANMGYAYMGTNVLGAGFTLSADQRRDLLAYPANADRVCAFLGGQEINSSPTQSPERFIINFAQMSLDQAERWPDLIAIIRAKVKPERDRLRDSSTSRAYKKFWWRFGRYSVECYGKLSILGRCLVNSQVTTHLVFAFQPPDRVFAHTLYVFPLDTDTCFAVLQSRVHESWARLHSSSLEDRLRYLVSDCFDTFPFPQPDPRTVISEVEAAGEALYEARAKFMIDTDQGLTKTYNALKNPKNDDPRILHLRELHEAIDRAVLDAYGWTDIEVPPFCPLNGEDAARLAAFEDEVIDRLYVLNAERAREEARLGLGKKPKGKKTTRKKKKPDAAGQQEIFSEDAP